MPINETPTRPNHVFVVRVWSESEHPAPDQWRGSVEHVPSGRRMYFTSLADMTDFIALHLQSASMVVPNSHSTL